MDDATRDALNFIANDAGFSRHAFMHLMEAMKVGYAATSEKKGTIIELPGLKTIEYRHNDWRVLDAYLVTPQSDYSGGGTTIWYGPVPVWTMQYVGHYKPEAIACLKAALKQQYESGVFNGGRGPDFFRHGSCTYINRVEQKDFRHAHGEDTIFGAGGAKLGWHRYQCVYMVERK